MDAHALFKQIDTDGSGTLDEKELKTAMDSTPTSERADYAEHWSRMLGYADKDVGGKKEFSFEAFLKLTDDLNLGRFASSS
jgi:Ca2+-binding EF-hand superfamily protein